MENALNIIILLAISIIAYKLFFKSKKSEILNESELNDEITELKVQLGIKEEQIRSLKESKQKENEKQEKKMCVETRLQTEPLAPL